MDDEKMKDYAQPSAACFKLKPVLNSQSKYVQSLTATLFNQSDPADEPGTSFSVDGKRAIIAENFYLRKQDSQEGPTQVMDVDYSPGIDINMKHAPKKVLFPEDSSPQDNDQPIVVHPTVRLRQPQKRRMEEPMETCGSPSTQHPTDQETALDLIEEILSGRVAGKSFFHTFNQERFSGINLRPVQNEVLNSGSFGDVVKVMDKQTGEQLVLKKLRNKDGILKIEANEMLIPLQMSSSPNIATFLGFIWNDNKLSFVMEDAGISLKQMVFTEVEYNQFYKPFKLEKIMLDMYTGLSHLAARDFIHGDIKPENVCIDPVNWVAKLIDFGSAQTKKDVKGFKGGLTPEYLDPRVNKFIYEYCVEKKADSPKPLPDEKDDVYAGGLCGLFPIMKGHPMIRHFTGYPLYPQNPAETSLMQKQVIKKISELTEEVISHLLTVPMSGTMKTLLSNVLSLNRNRRWTAGEAVVFLQDNLIHEFPPQRRKLFKQESLDHPKAEDLLRGMTLKADKIAEELPNIPAPIQQDISQDLSICFKKKGTSAQFGGTPGPAAIEPSMRSEKQMDPILGTSQKRISTLSLPPDIQDMKLKFKCQQERERINEDEDRAISFGPLQFGPSSGHMPAAKPLLRFQKPVQQVPAQPQVGQVAGNMHQRLIIVSRPYSTIHGRESGNRPVLQGLTGQNFQLSEHGYLVADPPAEYACSPGNIPDMDALFGEESRPKSKGRRSHN